MTTPTHNHTLPRTDGPYKIPLAAAALVLLGACADTVYTFQDFHDDGTSSNAQIYKISEGGGATNLSNNAHYDTSADVRHDGEKIVFRSVRGGADGHLYTMDMDGSNQAVIPNTLSAGAPRWSKFTDSSIIYFTNDIHTATEEIWRIDTNGSDKVQITFPGANRSDELAEDIDGKHIIYQRYDRDTRDRDLYVKYVWDDRPEQRMTNTPDVSESLPVASHDGSMVAYRAFHGAGVDDQIIVAQFTGAGLMTLHTINPDMPVNTNISGLDFSPNDAGIYFSAQADDSALNPINRRQELFYINLDGTAQVRLTDNTDSDTYPSTVP